jgi:hypothetical protein
MRRNEDEVIRKRSGWLIPLGVFAVVAALSAVLMMYYLAPGGSELFQEQVAPTSGGDTVAITVRGVVFRVPANYLQYESARRAGARREMALFALLPGLTGWSNWQADAFADNSADSKVVFITIREDRNDLTEGDRLKRVYMNYVKDPRGAPGPFGLRQYGFRFNSGYRDEDLFIGTGTNEQVVMRCVRQSDEVPNPSCLRDTMIAGDVALSYRFKRTHLADWRNIADRVDALQAEFRSRK